MVEVTLINWTPKPVETVYWAFMNMHNEVPNSLDKIKLSEKDKIDFMDMLLLQPHQTVLEYINTVWLIKGASRAFQQQLTRTRDASYSIQSLRIVPVNKFADNMDYTKSKKTIQSTTANNEYDKTMVIIQKQYNKLIAMGCPVEDARGILPLNVHSPITMNINMRGLYHMLELRFCENTQEEYREMAKQMKSEIEKKLHPAFVKPMKPLCFKAGKCLSPFPCDKYPQMEKAVKMDVSKWLKG